MDEIFNKRHADFLGKDSLRYAELYDIMRKPLIDKKELASIMRVEVRKINKMITNKIFPEETIRGGYNYKEKGFKILLFKRELIYKWLISE